MKTYPSKWNTAQLAYFSGLLCTEAILSGKIELRDIEGLTLESSYVPSGGSQREVRFPELIARLEPMITGNNWASIVSVCQRVFV